MICANRLPVRTRCTRYTAPTVSVWPALASIGAQNSTDAAAPRLMIGAFVEVSIEGREVSNVVRLDRAYLRKEDTVWVHEDGVLRVRPVEVAFRDAEFVYITDGLEDGDKVVITGISTPVDGETLRLKPPEAAMKKSAEGNP